MTARNIELVTTNGIVKTGNPALKEKLLINIIPSQDVTIIKTGKFDFQYSNNNFKKNLHTGASTRPNARWAAAVKTIATAALKTDNKVGT